MPDMTHGGVRWPGIMAWLIVGLALGCSTVEPTHERVCVSCDDQQLVRIGPLSKLRSDDQGKSFQHPLTLTQAEWETVVRSVLVRSVHNPLLAPSYQGATEPLFLDEEVRDLGRSLRQAFQQVTAQEQVVFAVARSAEGGVTRLTSGAWFIQAGRVHLRLANCRVVVTLPSIRKQIWIDPLFAQDGPFYELVPGERQALIPPAREGGNPFRPEVAELAIDYHGKTEEAAPASSVDAVPSAPVRSLEEPMALLKRWYEQGLITDEEYRAKKQQLLDRL